MPWARYQSVTAEPSPAERETAIRQLVPLYCRMGEYEKAKALACDQSGIVISREVLLPSAAVGDEKARYQGERILALLGNLHLAVSEAVALRPSVSSSEYGKEMLLSVIRFYEEVFVDGRCGRWHWEIGFLYLTLADYEMDGGGDVPTALGYFDKGFAHCREYQRVCGENEYRYSAPLVAALPKIVKGDLIPLEEDFWEKRLRTCPPQFVDAIRGDPKYSECFE